MRYGWLGAFVTSLVVLLSSVNMYGDLVIFGDEIPWPFSEQFEISKEHSEGLWMIKHLDGSESYLNLEMVETQDHHVSWMRVSELDVDTLEVISWGEGYFCNSSTTQAIVFENSIPIQDEIGKYVYMFQNGNFNIAPYLLRLVEVNSGTGPVLGVSTYFASKEVEPTHVLGLRVLKKPFECKLESNEGAADTSDRMVCELTDMREKK